MSIDERKREKETDLQGNGQRRLLADPDAAAADSGHRSSSQREWKQGKERE